MRKFANNISKGFTWFFFIFTAFLFASMLFFSNSSRHIDFIWRLASFFIALVFFIAFTWGMQKAYSHTSFLKKNENRFYFLFIGIAFVVLFILQVFMVSKISTDIGWDCGTLVVTAMQPDLNYGAEYFSIYPNNLFLLFIYRFIIAFFTKIGIQNIWLGFSIINTLLVDFSIFLTVLICYKQWGKKISLFAFLLFAALFGFSPWLIVPYSDTISMPFVIGTITLYFFAICASKTWVKILFSAFIGFVLVAGYFIKPTVLVAGVAIFIVQIIRILRQLNLKICLRQLCFLFAMSFFAGGFFGLYQTYQKNQTMITIEPNRAMPAIGFYMMGLTISGEPDVAVYGAWNQDDINILFKAHTTENMANVAKEEISLRLQKMGSLGYLKYLSQKARWITADGIFFWAGEGNFANWDGNTKPSLAKELVYLNGEYFKTYQIIAQGIWSAFFFFLVLSGILTKKSKVEFLLLLCRVAMFGILLFVMLFEGRSRYLINFIPVFTILSANGFSSFLKNLQLYFRNLKSEK